MFDDEPTPYEQAAIVQANKDSVEFIEKTVKKWNAACHFKIGTIGFGRPCVGVLDSRTDCYVGWADWMVDDSPSYPPPDSVENSYHKGPYISVLVRDGDYGRAIAELYLWIKFYEDEKMQFDVLPRGNGNILGGQESLLVKK